MRSAMGTLAPPPTTCPGSAPSPLMGGENRPGEEVLCERAGPGASRVAPSKLMRQTERRGREEPGVCRDCVLTGAAEGDPTAWEV